MAEHLFYVRIESRCALYNQFLTVIAGKIRNGILVLISLFFSFLFFRCWRGCNFLYFSGRFQLILWVLKYILTWLFRTKLQLKYIIYIQNKIILNRKNHLLFFIKLINIFLCTHIIGCLYLLKPFCLSTMIHINIGRFS